jgi:hypothetical protein
MFQTTTGIPFVCNGLLTKIVWIFNRCDNSSEPGIYRNVTYQKTWIDNKCTGRPQMTSLAIKHVILAQQRMRQQVALQ